MKNEDLITEWTLEIHKAIYDIGSRYQVRCRTLANFLFYIVCRQFALAGLKEKDVKRELDLMMENYKRIEEQIKEERINEENENKKKAYRSYIDNLYTED